MSRPASLAEAWDQGYKTGYSHRGPHGEGAGNPVPPNPYKADPDPRAEIARLTNILNELGFCPTDGESMPCFTCGAGL